MKTKRSLSFLLCFLLVIVACIGRVGYVGLSEEYYASSSYNSYTLLIDKKYPTVYDIDSSPLTNASDKYVAVIKPDEKCLSELSKLFTSAEIADITQELKSGYPIVHEIDAKYKDTKLEYIKIMKCKVHYDSHQICSHLISSVTGGVESHFSDLFSDVKELSVNYAVDAKGRLLAGDTGTVQNDDYRSQRGIGLAIDKKIQQIAESAMDTSRIEKGAVVITDVDSGAVLALCSRPNIDLNHISDTENDFVNRALQPFSVGSIFKIVVACCALENGLGDTRYTCAGKIRVADTEYACQNTRAHGAETLKTALANSCNCYFVNLALKLGKDKLWQTAYEFGFGGETYLGSDWKVSNGVIDDVSLLKSDGRLALLGFGQGHLSATPLMFASVVSTVANGGIYYEPYIVDGYIDDDGTRRKTTSASDPQGRRIISQSTAKTMQSYLEYVVTNGTGSQAQSSDGLSAGKTSTAQSGQYSNGREILHTWFAGYYPSDDPEYAVVIMDEDGTSGGGDCGPVFRQIVDKLATLQ